MFAHLGRSQGAQYPLEKEYALNHIIKAPMIYGILLNLRGIGLYGDDSLMFSGELRPNRLDVACETPRDSTTLGNGELGEWILMMLGLAFRL